jgi:hypothetical protein
MFVTAPEVLPVAQDVEVDNSDIDVPYTVWARLMCLLSS